MSEPGVSMILWFWCTLWLSLPGLLYGNFMPLFFFKLSAVLIRSLIWNLDFFMPRPNLWVAQVLLASIVPCYFVAIFRVASVHISRNSMEWYVMKENGYSTSVASVGLCHAPLLSTPGFLRIAPAFRPLKALLWIPLLSCLPDFRVRLCFQIVIFFQTFMIQDFFTCYRVRIMCSWGLL